MKKIFYLLEYQVSELEEERFFIPLFSFFLNAVVFSILFFCLFGISLLIVIELIKIDTTIFGLSSSHFINYPYGGSLALCAICIYNSIVINKHRIVIFLLSIFNIALGFIFHFFREYLDFLIYLTIIPTFVVLYYQIHFIDNYLKGLKNVPNNNVGIIFLKFKWALPVLFSTLLTIQYMNKLLTNS